MPGLQSFSEAPITLFSVAKDTVVRLRLHRALGWLEAPLLRAAMVLAFSRWRDAHRDLPIHLREGGTFDGRRFRFYDELYARERLDGPLDYLEFGVAAGQSFRWWVDRNRDPRSRFIGFDTFTGLPEDWGRFRRGHFDTAGIPPDIGDPRCRFVSGLFAETLPRFVAEYDPGPRRVVHVDCDLYGSALTVLTGLAGHLRPGDLVLFDEFSALAHEFRAWTDFLSARPMPHRVVGEANDCSQVAILVQ